MNIAFDLFLWVFFPLRKCAHSHFRSFCSLLYFQRFIRCLPSKVCILLVLNLYDDELLMYTYVSFFNNHLSIDVNSLLF